MLEKARLLFGGIFRKRATGITPLPPAALATMAGLKERMGKVSLKSISSMDWEKIYRKSFLYNSIATVICAYFVADFLAVAMLPFLPPPVPPRPRLSGFSQKQDITAYEGIFASNAFSDLVRRLNADDMNRGLDGPPVRTSLPLTLLGVIVVSDEFKSVASVEDKGSNQVIAVRKNESITSGTRVEKIELDRLIFINESAGRREFIELPKDQILATRKSSPAPSKSGIQANATGDRFAIARDEVDKTLANLNEVLTQARCVPNFEAGRPGGYRCFQIVPGSIYDKLGMKDNDVILAINGEAINDPSKAFTMLTGLKNAETRSIELTVNRNGNVKTMTYDIN